MRLLERCLGSKKEIPQGDTSKEEEAVIPSSSCLWNPHEPDFSESASADNNQLPKPNCLATEPEFTLNMDFGGLAGTRLSLLNRIVAFHNVHENFFQGFGFFYTDGTSKLFGRRDTTYTMSLRFSCVEQSCSIDGPGGERIVSIQIGYSDPEEANDLKLTQVRALTPQICYSHSKLETRHQLTSSYR